MTSPLCDRCGRRLAVDIDSDRGLCFTCGSRPLQKIAPLDIPTGFTCLDCKRSVYKADKRCRSCAARLREQKQPAVTAR